MFQTGKLIKILKSIYVILYFEFEEKRRKADVKWPKDDEPVVVQLTDKELSKSLPSDLYYEIDPKNKVIFTIENPDNKRLLALQKTIAKRLQEFANQL